MITISRLTCPRSAVMDQRGFELTYIARVYEGDPNTYCPEGVPCAWDVQPSRELRDWVRSKPSYMAYSHSLMEDQSHIEIYLTEKDAILFKLYWM